MANGHVEIHDPFTKHNHQRSKDDDDDDDDEEMAVMPEFRLLMAYAKRRRGVKESPGENGNGTPAPPPPPARTEEMDDNRTMPQKKKKKKKRGWQRLPNILTCIKPQTRDIEPEQISYSPENRHRCVGATKVKKSEEEEELDCAELDCAELDCAELDCAAKCLTKIADQIPFLPPDLETDSPDDDVERLIGLLLREHGDALNERELRDLSIAKELFWNYSFFKQIISTLLNRMGFRTSDPESPGPHASPKAQLAVACEATFRLSAMETQPMNRLLGYGSRYLKEHHSSWAQEHGGYDAAFKSDEEEEDDVE